LPTSLALVQINDIALCLGDCFLRKHQDIIIQQLLSRAAQAIDYKAGKVIARLYHGQV
jgi:hypothetical protein